MAIEEFSNNKSNQQTNVKCETLEKGPKRKYTRKSKTDEKAKEMIDQMINEQTNEQTNEQVIEPSKREIIEEKYDQRISELCNQHGGTDKKQDERRYLDKSIEEIDKIRQNLIDSLPPNVGLVKTAHGGLHINCNKNFYQLPSNRNVKVAVTDSYNIDLFAQMTKYKIENGQEAKEIIQNRVVAPNTSIRETKNNQRVTLKYEAINDQENVSHLASLREILDKWNIDIEMSSKDYAQQLHDRKYGVQVNDEGSIEQMNDELAQACVDGLMNLDIRNYSQPINMEVSLLSIFCGLYGITNESIRAEGMKNLRQFNKLSPNADKNYGQASLNGERKPNPWILTKILRYHNKDYYEQIIKPLLKKNYEVTKQSKIVDTVNKLRSMKLT
ncbi:MAG: hypothetical protein EZS28_024998 [Streblomastix strix]|uniref:Uncharacterized protein n=1 Tax=Streblomastix strix TaxID=222440 RepID=A0A5J4VAV0_9EUKA|nr:MAG: hypothetical protein EZS28_024998 [Streblomastix strix]